MPCGAIPETRHHVAEIALFVPCKKRFSVTHQDTVGVLGLSVKDAALALDGIYGVDSRERFTSEQRGETPKKGFAQFTAKKEALKNARFAIPWDTFWALNSPDPILELLKIVQFLSDEGATVVNGTEPEGREILVNPTGWDWDWRGKLGFPNLRQSQVLHTVGLNAYIEGSISLYSSPGGALCASRPPRPKLK
ncbi:hypothetical protein GGR58DRAFT_509068 [Xylaria digitata]|nr:hypothetical protein GGR58DRAFT_509068 [Xylaria digitata]